MKPRLTQILASIPSSLVALFLILASAMPKLFLMGPGTELNAFAQQLGMGQIYFQIGLLELLCGILLLIPRTFTVGFILTIGLLGGAMATSLTHNAEGNWWWFPLIFIGLLMISAWFKSPELLARLRGKKA